MKIAKSHFFEYAQADTIPLAQICNLCLTIQ